MANPYTKPSLSGYNSSPPPDDGSKTAANEIKWDTHKSKIGDPLKNYIDAINQEAKDAFGEQPWMGIKSISSDYTVQSSDRGLVIECTGTITVTLLPAATAGNGFPLLFVNNGSGTVTIDGDGSETINGDTTLGLYPRDSATITCDGSKWAGDGGTADPPGTVQMYGGNSEPNGFKFCNGQALSRTDFAALFSFIGTRFGNGDGSTTFNVPDLRDRFPLGDNTMGSSDAGRVDNTSTSIGDTGGTDSETLTISEMPAHDHGGSTGNSTVNHESDSGTTGTQVPGVVEVGTNETVTTETLDSSSHSHSISSEGGGNAHNNMPPFLAINFIIKT